MSEMPEPLVPAEGARVIEYPWARASAAVDALNALRSELEAQLANRPGLLETIVDWQGGARRDFDETYGELSALAQALLEETVSVANAICTGADWANADQLAANNQASLGLAGDGSVGR